MLMLSMTPPSVATREDCACSLFKIRFIILLTSVRLGLGTQVGQVLVQIYGFVIFAKMQWPTKRDT
jgi:hypothetical protein